MKLKNQNWPHGLAGSRQFFSFFLPNNTKSSHHQRACAPNANHTQYHHLTPKTDSYNSITVAVFSVAQPKTACPTELAWALPFSTSSSQNLTKPSQHERKYVCGATHTLSCHLVSLMELLKYLCSLL
jgi:hypothetical protein